MGGMESNEIEQEFSTCTYHTDCFTDFGKAKFADGGSILGSKQLSILSKLPL